MAWELKEISLSDVPGKIPNGSTVYIGSTASTAEAVLGALVDCPKSQDIQIVQMIPGGDLPHLRENVDRFRTSSFFPAKKGPAYFKNTPEDMTESLQDYTPMSVTSIPRLLKERILKVEVAIIKVTPPHKGYCSLGFGVECTRDFVNHASIVIAEVSNQMPWTEGHSKLRVSEIDWWVSQHDTPLKTTAELWPESVKKVVINTHPQSVIEGIGQNLIKEIPDGATLKIGWNPITWAVFPYLHQRKNLGLHTDVILEALFRLQEQGVIDNTQKSIDPNRSVVAQAHGSQDLYEFLDRNPGVEFHSVSYINDPIRLSQIDNLAVIEGALKVDLTGQVATDSIAHKFYGGVWSVDESIRGAKLSEGGKPLIALPARSLQGRSNIVFELPPGTGVSISRSDVEYVITEYGTAYLYGKSIRERCLALIEIAHPDFRHELLTEAKKHHYISEFQPGYSFNTIYPSQFECLHTTAKGKTIFARPIKAADEDLLRHFFHKLSNHSVYLRYFRRLRSMPQRILQKYTDVDYSRDMALVALYPPANTKGQQEMVAIAQWIAPSSTHSDSPDMVENDNNNNGNGNLDNIDSSSYAPEIAFQVRDDWQGEGLGKYLFGRLVEISKSFDNFKQFKADVLADNRGMRRVFESSGLPYKTKIEFGVVTYFFDLPS